jgi:hypothetical protein
MGLIAVEHRTDPLETLPVSPPSTRSTVKRSGVTECLLLHLPTARRESADGIAMCNG